MMVTGKIDAKKETKTRRKSTYGGVRELEPSPQATSAGAKEQEAINFLEKKVKGANAGNEFTLEETVQTAVACLQTVLGEDLKAKELEVGIVTSDNRNFRLLKIDEVEEHLTAISERD